MKVLVVPTPSTGHLLAMVPFCWALRLAGHDVLVAARRDATATALRSGLQAADLPELQVPMDELRKAVNPSMFPAPVFADRDQPSGQGMWHFAAQSWFGQAGQYLDAYVAVAKDWGADMVLSDPLATVGRALGAALELPVLVHRWGIDPTGGPFAERTAALAAESGTALADPAAILDICPASLQAPDAPAGTALRFIPFNGTGLLPEWHRNTKGRKRITVCLGGSTLSLTGPRPLLAILDAVRRVDAEVIVTLSAADRASVGALPDGVRVVEDVPLQLFLADCDLLIHHGGSTTGFTACRYGVPQLVLPQMFDQFDYARGITRTGAGLAAVDAAAQADSGALTDSIANLLRDSAFRDGAEQVGRDILAAPSPHEVVARIVAPRAG